MPRFVGKIHFHIEREQPIEQWRLAIIVPGREPAVRDLFAAVLQQSEPQQRAQNSRLYGVGRPVPRSRKHRRFRDGAKPRQFLAGLPVIIANRQRSKHNAGVRLRPRAKQSAAEIPEIHVPERKMEKNRGQAALPLIAQHRFSQGRHHQLAAPCAHQSSRLREHADDMQGQETHRLGCGRH